MEGYENKECQCYKQSKKKKMAFDFYFILNKT